MAYEYPFFDVQIDEATRVATVRLNRPDKRNAMNWDYWRDLPLLVEALELDPKVRVVVFAGAGDSFSIGLDLKDFFIQFAPIFQGERGDHRERLMQLVKQMQLGMDRIEQGANVYIAAVHGWCIGAGLDMAAACDLRLCSQDAKFSLREAKVAIVADIGSLQRLPSIIGLGNTRLMAFTGGDYSADEAHRMHLVEAVHDTPDALLAGAQALAAQIAQNPAIAIRGTKRMLNYARDHSVQDGLDYVATWNAAFLDSIDFRETIIAFMEKRAPKYQ
jgi:enoyl-CoA hydratase